MKEAGAVRTVKAVISPRVPAGASRARLGGLFYSSKGVDPADPRIDPPGHARAQCGGKITAFTVFTVRHRTGDDRPGGPLTRPKAAETLAFRQSARPGHPRTPDRNPERIADDP